jgi:Family of unknown function (DUF6502)
MTGDTLPSPVPGASPPAPDPLHAYRALADVLQPLARLMIDHGLQLPSAVELLKQALVVEAEVSFGPSGKTSSDTRVAVLTGVHRKDVRRLRAGELDAVGEAARAAGDAPPPAAALMSLSASVVARWLSEPKYLGADRTPLRLARTPRHAPLGMPDFTGLVAEVSRDVGARAVLDELQRLGVVAVHDEVWVVLERPAFVPQGEAADRFHFLAANVSDHVSTAVHNLSPRRVGAVALEQSAFSAALSPAQAEALHAAARTLWGQALQQFLQAATQAEARSAGEPGPRQRVRFGTYFHQVDDPLALPGPVGMAVAVDSADAPQHKKRGRPRKPA